MIHPAHEPASEDLRSSSSHNKFAKLFLMYQTAREGAEWVSDDCRSSAYQDAFEKVLSISLKDLVLRIEWRNFSSFASSVCIWVYESILCHMSSVAAVVCRGRCLFFSVHWVHHDHPVLLDNNRQSVSPRQVPVATWHI
jgi:hypothetical protein